MQLLPNVTRCHVSTAIKLISYIKNNPHSIDGPVDLTSFNTERMEEFEKRCESSKLTMEFLREHVDEFRQWVNQIIGLNKENKKFQSLANNARARFRLFAEDIDETQVEPKRNNTGFNVVGKRKLEDENQDA